MIVDRATIIEATPLAPTSKMLNAGINLSSKCSIIALIEPVIMFIGIKITKLIPTRYKKIEKVLPFTTFVLALSELRYFLPSHTKVTL